MNRNIKESTLEITLIIIGIITILFLMIIIPLVFYLFTKKRIFKIIVIISLSIGFFIMVVIIGFLR
jgi:hypothetical protein